MNGREAKIQAVEEFLRWCATRDPGIRSDSMKVNYFSASRVGYNVMTTASVVNTAVYDFLEDGIHCDRGHAFGACLLDGLPTAGPAIKLIRILIDRNFQGNAMTYFLAQARWHDSQRKARELRENFGRIRH